MMLSRRCRPRWYALLVTIRRMGRLTYVDLALGPQWMNVTPGAFRLLANILSQ
jgi:hypothetical protein